MRNMTGSLYIEKSYTAVISKIPLETKWMIIKKISKVNCYYFATNEQNEMICTVISYRKFIDLIPYGVKDTIIK